MPVLGPRRRRWPRRLALTAVVGTALFALIGFLVVPPVARRVAEKQLGEALGRRVSIERIRLNPFSLALAVEGFTLYEADGQKPFVGFTRLYVNAEWSSLFRRAPIVRELRLESPRVHVVRLKAIDGPEAWGDTSAYNFSDILAHLAAQPKSPEPPPPPPGPEGPPPRFSLNNIKVTDGLFTFDDLPGKSHHEIAGFEIGVPFVSTLPVYLDAFVEPGLGLRLDGTPFAMKARTKPFKESLDTTLDLRLDALDLTRYLPYAPLPVRVAVTSARLSVALGVSFVRAAGGTPAIKVGGTVALDDLAISKSEGAPLAGWKRLAIEVAEADVTRQHVHVKSVLLDGLDVHARRLGDGSLDWEHLAPPKHEMKHATKPASKTEGASKSVTPAAKSTGAGPTFLVDEVRLTHGAVHLRDESVRPAFAANVEDLTLEVKELSNTPGREARVSLSLAARPGGHLVHHGKLSLVPLTADGEVTLTGLSPAAFAPYYRDQLAFDLVKGGLDLGATYHVRLGAAAPSVKLEKAFVTVSDVELRRPGREPFFRLGGLEVRDTAVDLEARVVRVGGLATHDGRVRAQRDAHGVIDLTTLTTTAPVTAPDASRKPTTPAKPSAPTPATKPAPDERPWAVTVAKLDVERWSARFEDQAVSPAAVEIVDPITLHATELSTVPRARATVALQLGLNKTGRLKLGGTATLTPLAANLNLELASLAVLPLQPYFTPFVNLTVTSGALSVKGKAVLAPARAEASPALTFDGDIDVNDFAAAERASSEPLLSFASFHVGALHVASEPQAVAIKEVALTDFRSRLVMYPDAHLNVQDLAAPSPTAPAATGNARGKTAAAPPTSAPPALAAKPSPTTPTPTPPAAEPRLTIGQITLQGGHVSYQDRLIKPPVTAELTELGGRLSSLSNDPATQADVDLRGAVNHSGTLTIVGRANPLAKELSLDVKVDLKDFELPPTSPYAAKFAGYGIAKGKLNLSLAYNIAGRKVDAKNRLVLEQFTFGDKVDSPDAVNLPVRLAVALLKDRHGVIDIDLPISGSLDDPQFKLGRLILKTLGNLIAKAATAPFALLASAFGGGDEMSHLSFPNGLSTPEPSSKARLGTLAKVLRERPGLSFEVEGAADPQADREGLRRYLTERKLKAEKMNDLVQQGSAVPSLDAVTLSAEERPGYLARVYKAAPFPKPRNAAGLEKSLSPEEQERLLLTNTPVADDDLRALALRRATSIQSELVRLVPEASSRIFLVTPRLGTPGREVECKIKKD